jgi:triphosphatase
VRPSNRSKSARGFDLADGRPPAAPQPDRPVLDPEAPVDEAFAAILRGGLRHLLQSLPAAENGENPEGVHQARVALRRLRSAFALMYSVAASASIQAFSDEAKRLAGSLGDAREADIFVEETLGPIETALPGLDGFDRLRRLAEAKRAEGYAAARAALADQRTSRFILELGAWIEQRGWRSDVAAEGLGALGEPAIRFADRTLDGLRAKVLKRGRHFKSMTPGERHKLRLAVKKLRYASDFLMPLYGGCKAAKRFVSRLADLQEELGRYNDMATTRDFVARLGEDPAGRSEAAGAVIGWQAQGLASAEPRLRAAWRAFGETRPPWPAGEAAPDPA